jgi:hypothetical protein
VTFGTPTNTSATIDFTTFALWGEKYLNNMSFMSFKIPFPTIDFLPQFNGYDRFTSGYNASFISYLSEVCLALESHNWLNKAYYYIFDEPLVYQYENIIRTVELCRQAAPNLKILLTEPPCPALNHSIDIWVPYTLEYDEAIAQNQIAQGDDSWWYVYAQPKSPFSNFFINEPGFDHRILFWSTFVQNITGFVYWGVDVWQYQDVWKEPMTGEYGNGEGYIFYNPDKSGIPSSSIISGPVSSVRAELIREGIEDFDCFYLLRNLTATVSAFGNPEYNSLLEDSQALLNRLLSFASNLSSYSQSIPEMINLRQSISYQLEDLWNILYKDIIEPSISINSPNPNDLFGTTAPDFDVTINDSSGISTQWYMIDGELFNYMFIGSTGTINQTAWNGKGNGTVIIRFYANDTAGNIAWQEVIVRKDIILPFVDITNPSPDGTQTGGSIISISGIGYGTGSNIVSMYINDTKWGNGSQKPQNDPSGSESGAFVFNNNTYIAPGFYWIKINITDVAGNFNISIRYFEVIIIKDVPTPNPRIPGYNLFILLGVLSVIIIIMERKWKAGAIENI